MSRAAFPLLAILLALLSGLTVHALRPSPAGAAPPRVWVDPPRKRASWTVTSPTPLSASHAWSPDGTAMPGPGLLAPAPASRWRVAAPSRHVPLPSPLPPGSVQNLSIASLGD